MTLAFICLKSGRISYSCNDTLLYHRYISLEPLYASMASPGFAKSIKEIPVYRLFGRYTYSIAGSMYRDQENSKLLILYGDNGSGKTTLLKLVYNLLSPRSSRGHRTFLAKTVFQNFTVEFYDGTVIGASREGPDLIGDYNLYIYQNQKMLLNVFVETEEGPSVPQSFDSVEYRSFLSFLRHFDLTLYYLSDDRQVQTSSDLHDSIHVIDDDHDVFIQLDLRLAESERAFHYVGNSKRRRVGGDVRLQLALSTLTEWVRIQALEGANMGSDSNNNIYYNVVKQLGTSRLNVVDNTEYIDEITEDLKKISREITDFAAFGLLPRSDFTSLISAVEDVPSHTRALVRNVLTPYIDGFKTRLEALRGLKDILEIFIDSLNNFYIDKFVSFNMYDGLSINTHDGERLNPNDLSSGERQLLLLFANTIIASEGSSIFIIDEPEISLNVKWQRQLIQTLLRCVEHRSVQFVIATHSIELLTRYKEDTVRLNNSHELRNAPLYQ